MRLSANRRVTIQTLCWSALLLLPSVPISARLLGIGAAAALWLLGSVLFVWGLTAARMLDVSYQDTVVHKAGVALAVLQIAIAVAFVFAFPAFNAQVPGQGSDRDDALNVAVNALLAGQYPYDRTTYLGNPVTPLPGALLLATPFVLLGNAAYQAVFWLVAWCAAVFRAKPGASTALLASAVACSPEALRETLTGGDFLANGIYVVLAIWLLACTFDGHVRPRWHRSAAALLLAVALASRPHFSLVLPVVAAAIAHGHGTPRALLAVGCLSLVAAAICVPFYLYAPDGFSPLHVASKLAVPGRPDVAPLLGLASITMSFALAWRCRADQLFARCALACALPVVMLMATSWVATGVFNVQLLAYLVCAAPFIGLALLRVDPMARR